MDQAIEIALNKIRPFLRRDGGDVEYIMFRDGIVYVRMLGACANCAFKDNTLSEGIENILVEEIHGVLGVIAVD